MGLVERDRLERDGHPERRAGDRLAGLHRVSSLLLWVLVLFGFQRAVERLLGARLRGGQLHDPPQDRCGSHPTSTLLTQTTATGPVVKDEPLTSGPATDSEPAIDPPRQGPPPSRRAGSPVA